MRGASVQQVAILERLPGEEAERRRRPSPPATPRAAAARPTRAAASANSTVRLEVNSASVMAAASGIAQPFRRVGPGGGARAQHPVGDQHRRRTPSPSVTRKIHIPILPAPERAPAGGPCADTAAPPAVAVPTSVPTEVSPWADALMTI